MIVTKRFLFYKTPHLYGARHVKHCKKAEALLSCRGNTTINNTNSNPLQVQKQICLNKIAQPYPSVYNATDVEHGWYDWWKMSGFFESSEATECKEVFSMILPPPNITGTLHLGHALTVTIQDVLVRWHRMKGDQIIFINR
jgi:valyl-tRNA synthetase